jgi:dihydrodipicolinate synthase/N-acetylneuraminate lyase
MDDSPAVAMLQGGNGAIVAAGCLVPSLNVAMPR